MRFIFLVCFLSFYLSGNSQTTFSLSQAVDYALNNQIALKKTQLDIEDANYQIKEILSQAIPKLNGSVEYQRFLQLPTQILPEGSFFEGDPGQGIPPNPEEDLEVQFGVKNSLSAGLSLSALVFDGSVFVGIQASRLARELAQSQVALTERDVEENVKKAYLAVLIAKRSREIIELNIQNLQETLNETAEMYKSGFVEKLDVDRLQYSLSNLEMEYNNNENMIFASKNVLKLQMGYPMEDSLIVSESLDEYTDVQSSVSLASQKYSFENRPEYKPLAVTEELREMDIKQLKFGYIPKVSLFANYNQQLQANKLTDGKWFPSSIVGGTIDIPIFDGRDRAMKIQRAEIRLQQHQLDVEETRRAMLLEAENARRDFITTLNRVQDSEDNLELAQEIFDVSQIKFREGVGSSVEMSQSESSFYQAQSVYINALYDFIIAKTNLEKAIGEL
ncbi:TolC family protein [Membranihabitans maritimus]|uniref:TolC family protein n=1 Tax=Membranihabitans maritimus TaxID=2904244 RepID=UPI001F3876C6|nr:TolC family protein [Membranihabitans maritimus]